MVVVYNICFLADVDDLGVYRRGLDSEQLFIVMLLSLGVSFLDIRRNMSRDEEFLHLFKNRVTVV